MTDRLQGEVIGFRQWTVNHHLELGARFPQHGMWVPGENVARCHRREDKDWGTWTNAPCDHAPGAGCECGLYGLHEPRFWYGSRGRARGFALGGVVAGEHPFFVAGLIVAWGKLEVHHTGFRAEYARVAAIATPTWSPRDSLIAKGVADEYGVPCVPEDELERIATEFGTPVPDELRPDPHDVFDEFYHVSNAMVTFGKAAGRQAAMYARLMQHASASTIVISTAGEMHLGIDVAGGARVSKSWKLKRRGPIWRGFSSHQRRFLDQYFANMWVGATPSLPRKRNGSRNRRRKA